MTNTDKELSSSVYVGGKEPTGNDRKKVWMQKGKNYLDISKLKSRTTYGITFAPTDTGIKISGTAYDTYAYGDSIKFDLEKGKTYTLYGNNAGNTLKLELKNNKTIFMSIKTTENKVTFTPSKNVESITFVLEGITKGTTYDYEISNLQIEQGSKATTFQPYVEPQIFIKNSNEVYEEFIKKQLESRITELEKYETGSANIEVATSDVQLNYYHKIGKVCTFCVEIRLAQDLNANASVKILSGLPNPKTGVRFVAYYGTDKVCRLFLLNGNIFLWYNANKISSGEYLNIFITYITD